jgi:hypothetical protein
MGDGPLSMDVLEEAAASRSKPPITILALLPFVPADAGGKMRFPD